MLTDNRFRHKDTKIQRSKVTLWSQRLRGVGLDLSLVCVVLEFVWAHLSFSLPGGNRKDSPALIQTPSSCCGMCVCTVSLIKAL